MVEIRLAVSEKMQRALMCHRSGDLVEAERLYKEILDANPDHIEAFHLLGAIEYRRGHYKVAIRLISKALAIKPDFAEALNNRGNVLFALDRQQEALASYDEALAVNPTYTEALNNRGNVLGALNRTQEALESYEEALAIKPDFAEALYNRGNALFALDRRQDALESFERALAVKPNFAKALFDRGKVLAALNRQEEALDSLDKGLVAKPDYVDALYNRGEVLRTLHRQAAALTSYNDALAIKPDFAEALNNRGIVLGSLSRQHEALQSFDKALAVKPYFVEALNNRGEALRVLQRLDEALASYDEALAVMPDAPAVLHNRGIVLLKLGRHKLAIESYEKALAIEPNSTIHSGLIYALNFEPTASAARQQAERARWNELYAQQFATSISPHKNDPNPRRRLSIGYVSSHFRYQASTHAFGGVLVWHDPASFEVVCYSDTVHEDGVTAQLRACSDKWHHIVDLSDDEVGDLIRADGIDILVDCVGHMGGHRLLVFARKPAPIQVTAWGEPTGTGLKTMDYLLADPVLVPMDERALLAERVFDIPNFLGYWMPEPLPEPGALPAIANGFVTFGSFNRLEKLQEPLLRSWAAVLRTIPNSQLIIKGDQRCSESSIRARFLAVFNEEGVETERVMLLDPSNRADHFAAYQRIDIALDPFPHGGGMTTLDALWMGVPVVTWAGCTISSRLAAASLTNLELTDFIASDPESYVNLVIAKARNIDALGQLRASLRGRIAGSVIGNPSRYARAVEAAYRELWQRWCASTKGERREGLSVVR